MKPIREREAQYLWTQKSRRWKTRYLDALTGLYQDSPENDPDNTQDSTTVDGSDPILIG